MSRARDLADSADLNFDSGTLVIDSANNRVGIGTGSPEAELHLKQSGANKNGIKIERTDNTAEYLLLANHNGGSRIASVDENNVGREAIAFERSSNGSTFSESMRIDSSGNLLVGTTQTEPGVGNTNTGVTVNGANGRLIVSRSTGIPAYINRSSTDGTIVDLRKDGSTVGVIGVANGDNLYIAVDDTTDVGLKFDGDANEIYPCNASGGVRDDAVTLGDSASRFKDLYLSGGVYLGGTGSANYLDDYEEGTFTPTIVRSGTAPSYTASTAEGKYIKVGGLVHIQIVIIISAVSISGSGNVLVGGLPFVQAGSIYATVLNVGYNDVFDSAIKDCYTTGSQLQMIPTGITQSNYTGVLSTGYLGIGGTYTTDA